MQIVVSDVWVYVGCLGFWVSSSHKSFHRSTLLYLACCFVTLDVVAKSLFEEQKSPSTLKSAGLIKAVLMEPTTIATNYSYNHNHNHNHNYNYIHNYAGDCG